MNITQRCTCCGDEKPLEAFHKQSSSKRGHKRICKDCVREKNQKRYKKNKDKILAANKKWRDSRVFGLPYEKQGCDETEEDNS